MIIKIVKQLPIIIETLLKINFYSFFRFESISGKIKFFLSLIKKKAAGNLSFPAHLFYNQPLSLLA